MYRSASAVSVVVYVLAAFAGLVAIASNAHATKIAEWNFDDGTANDTLGNYDLNAAGGGPSISGGIASFAGDELSPAYLETAGLGGNPTWTIALRLRAASSFDQGTFQGIFSNNTGSSENYSWQIENSGGNYQFRSTGHGVSVIGAPTGGWDTIVVRKFSGSDGDIWFNGVQVVASLGANPGGLQFFRLGTNRNSSQFYEFDLDWAEVYTTVEDPALVPEPSSGLMMAMGLALLGVRRRESKA